MIFTHTPAQCDIASQIIFHLQVAVAALNLALALKWYKQHLPLVMTR